MKHLATIKRNRYIQALYSYGFITLCYLIEEYSKEENYEECQIILDALNEVNSTLNLNLPTRFDEKAFDYLNAAMVEIICRIPDVTIRNLPAYAETVVEMVNSGLSVQVCDATKAK